MLQKESPHGAGFEQGKRQAQMFGNIDPIMLGWIIGMGLLFAYWSWRGK